MSRSLKRNLLMAIALFGVLVIASCDRRPLEVMLDEKVKVNVKINWKVNFVEIYGNMPNGMTVMVWGSSDAVPKIQSTNSDNMTLYLQPDTYRMVIYSDTPEDYAYQSFFDYYSYDKLAMRSKHFKTKAWDDGVDYMFYPDEIGVALDTFLITRDMVERDTTLFVYYDDYKDHMEDIYREHTYTYEIPEVAWPMTVNLEVKAKIKRRQSLKTIEANISGMADGFYLSQIYRTKESGILRLVNDNTYQWSIEPMGEDIDSMGYAKFTIPSFGLPYGKELVNLRDPTDNVLSFYITLKDGSAVQCSFNVGKDIKYVTPEGREAEIRYRQDLRNLSLEIDLSDVIILPPVPGGDTGTGFDAKVDEWEDGGTIDMGGF